MIREHPSCKAHFEKIVKYRGDDEALVVQKKGVKGVKIILIDERYLFLSTTNTHEDEFLNRVISGGFFFEDIEKIYTNEFKKFFNRRSERVVIN